jgi:hypothetical protein
MATDKQWKQRIDLARRKREEYEDNWGQYARLHTNLYIALPDKNDSQLVTLPSGDQVKIGAVFRNIEQTFGLLEIPEISIEAITTAFTEEQQFQDIHKESIVSSALTNSLKKSGLLKGTEEVDAVKRDGVIVGHGISYSWWRTETRVITQPVPKMEELDGEFKAVLNPDESPVLEMVDITVPIHEAVQDEHVPVTEFLFEANAKAIRKAAWHGWERIVSLESLKDNPNYSIPKDIVGSAYQIKDLYGIEQPEQTVSAQDSVKLIIIYDKVTRELLTFLEAARRASRRRKSEKDSTFIKLSNTSFPADLSHPDDSPFADYVPIPANDRPFGISQIEHTKILSVETDKLRTRLANLTRQLKQIVFFSKSVIDEDQLSKALRSDDAEPVGVDKQPEESWGDILHQINPAGIPRDIYTQILQAENDIRKTSGIAEEPYGGAETATESQNIMAVGSARINRKRRLFLSYIECVASLHKDYLASFAPEGHSLPTIGADGVPQVLPYGRDVFQGEFELSAAPGGESVVATPVETKMFLELTSQILGKWGPVTDRLWMRQLFTRLKLRGISGLLKSMGNQQAPGLPSGSSGSGQATFNPQDQSNPQALRAGVNFLNES